MRYTSNLRASILGAGIVASFLSSSAMADLEQFPPKDKAFGFQTPVTEVAEQMQIFHNFWLMPIITAIMILVTVLLLVIIFKFNDKANPVAQKFSHNVKLEVAWTLIPVLILVVISFKSFPLLYQQDVIPEADLTVKVTGYQWYWDYEYTDPAGDVDKTLTYSSVMLTNEEADEAGKPRLLGVDNPMVVPVGKTIVVEVLAADVIHAFAMPAFGVKIDAVPGKMNQTWFKVNKPGIYYGQCSELCGAMHAYMPIEVHVLPEDEYNAWLAAKQAEYASVNQLDNVQLASAN
ncbi:MAG: cytochrome c oxidase subunit II [Robiginitomaculum sp.]|nr:cytochrome c oxidase subunit II [Robiginitomaculum sp.]